MEKEIERLKTTLYLVIALLGLKISFHMTDNNDEVLWILSALIFSTSVLMELGIFFIRKKYKDTDEYEVRRKEIRTYLITYTAAMVGAIFSLTL